MTFHSIKNRIQQLFHSLLFWIQVCAAGIWIIVIQNFVGRDETAKCVYVVGGTLDANVSGSVEVDNTVDVNVDNTVDVNVSAINGHTNAFYGPNNDGTYDAIHVYTGR